MDIYIRNQKIFRSILCTVIAFVLLVGSVPMGAEAATSAEIQKQIDNLKAENKEIQKQINAIQKQYDANFSDMKDIVAQKEAIDQEITLLNNKIETTNEQIMAYGQLIADTQEELDEAEEELLVVSQQHRERVRAMEEGGGISYWEVPSGRT